jgi:hypothetical protein
MDCRGRQSQVSLSHLTNLTRLDIERGQDTSDSYIRKLANLKSLLIDNEVEYDLDQLNLVDLASNLEHLQLTCYITPKVHDSLAALTNLTYLSLPIVAAYTTAILLRTLTACTFPRMIRWIFTQPWQT